MRFIETALPGLHLIETDPQMDSRGYFVRTFCAREFGKRGINAKLAQSSLSFNSRKGTIRGLHFQQHPSMEDKLVRCIRGAIFDVVLDIRPGSPTFGHWVGYELSEDNDRQVYVPQGFAHGFQTLTDDALVAYHIAQFYDHDKRAGIRWNDPDVNIFWPLPPLEQSANDLVLPYLKEIDPAQLLPFAVTEGQ